MRSIPIAAAALLAGTAMARADFPTGTIEMIIPFSAGGGTDIVARAFAPAFSDALGATVVVRNIDGASGTIGAAAAASARSDGYTIGYLPIGPVAIQPSLRELSYDIDSWEFICQTTDNPVLLMVADDSGIDSLEALAGQGRLIYGSSGPGTIPHLSMAATVEAVGIPATHVPYDGTGPAMTALAGGEIAAFVDMIPVVRANAVTPLAIFAAERHDDFPDVPTMAELGHDLQFSVWQGVFAPAGTEASVVETLSAACAEAVDSEAFRTAAANINTEVRFRDSAAFAEFVRANAEANREILIEAGLAQ